MLIFDRPEFKSGICKAKEIIQGKDGPVEKVYVFKPSDKGKAFKFENEADMLKRYPALFKPEKP